MSNAVTKTKDANQLLAQSVSRVGEVIPKFMNPERQIRLARLLVGRDRQLQQCNPMSIVVAVMDASRLGLEIGRDAHLVKFGNECVMIPDYRGLISLAMRGGLVKQITAQVVYAGDDFVWDLGIDPHIHHRPAMTVERTDDNIVAAYAVAHLANEAPPMLEVMTRVEIEKIRSTSKAGSGKDAPWVKWFGEMCRKTVVKRLCKYLPSDVELNVAVEHDTKIEIGQATHINEDLTVEVVDAETGEVAQAAAT